jgi:hypothetical protein
MITTSTKIYFRGSATEFTEDELNLKALDCKDGEDEAF